MQRFIFIALFALVAVISAKHDLFVGERKSGDYVIDQKVIDKDSKFLRKVEHTENFLADGNSKITYIEVIDYKNKTTSAIPKIISGGVGDSHVTIKFESYRNHGIHFIVKVYGRRA